MILRVVVAVSSANVARELAGQLAAPDVVVEKVRPSRGAWDGVVRKGGDVVIVSESFVPLPVGRSISVLNEMPEMPTTIVITDSELAEDHAGLLAAGCDTVLYSGLPDPELIAAIRATIETRRQMLRRSPAYSQPHLKPKLADFVSESPTMQMFMQVVDRIIPSNASVLILGETGVGKEHLARAIHGEGPRSSGPFVAVNCAALPGDLLESELFGHEEGAFTGATRSRRGAFEMAHGGALFLDEIGEMPLHLQAKLLRILQDFEVRRVGGETSLRVDVRVFAASNRDLEEASAAHEFRRDLYYRLSVIELTVPPLRDRRGDIPILAERFIARIAPKIGMEACGINDDAMRELCRYDWPGNVRELSNVLERALLLCDGEEIRMEDIPATITGMGSRPFWLPPGDPKIPQEWEGKTLEQVREEAINRIEQTYLAMLLAETGGRVGLAARRAGIHPRGLYNKMRKLGLRKEDFRHRQTPGADSP
ncbi:MAG TPA: sigma-54 dependent transcriptional regulator [Phycisphaerae bacterium]|nr:sigma-54 dependent transcriptional regulator [Phycisphaerae bacterium]